MEDKLKRMKELIVTLNQAAKVYYQGEGEIMSNFDYDKLYDELVALEHELDMTLANSPTMSVGFETLTELPKEAHVAPMLSLDKTKAVEELEAFLSEKNGVLSLKLDGLSVILTYQDGALVKALTRGNGEIGEVVTNNAKTFQNIPSRIPYKGLLIIRGEALIKYSDFERLNQETVEIAEKYKNPRNLCSGSLRQLNNQITKERKVNYLVYHIVNEEANLHFSTKVEQLEWLSKQGFEVVPYKYVAQTSIANAVADFSKEILTMDLPSDGLVLAYDDIEYGKSLGRTAKFPRDSIAFKWKDELAETTLLEVEWSASRTGLINPVAIFEPVELEGTTVARASVHNISILKELALGIGDKITVYKANMIIPQIQENLTRSNNLEIPAKCPVCDGETQLRNENGSEVLICTNPDCQAKKIKAFSHFVSRNGMNIEGLSESTLEKLIGAGMVKDFADLFHLTQHKEKLVEMDGFGQLSYQNLVAAIEKARHTTMPRLLYSLGIKGIGASMAKLICKHFGNNIATLSSLSVEDLLEVDGVGGILAESFVEYFTNESSMAQFTSLYEELTIEATKVDAVSSLSGLTFVITGSLEQFENRNQCKEKIEAAGGKVASTVSKNTDFLINNDSTSRSSKNKKAMDLGVSIITETQLLTKIQEGGTSNAN